MDAHHRQTTAVQDALAHWDTRGNLEMVAHFFVFLNRSVFCRLQYRQATC